MQLSNPADHKEMEIGAQDDIELILIRFEWASEKCQNSL